MLLRPICAVSALGCLLLPSYAGAQRAPRTTVVEVLGLREWSQEMVEDSVARYQPGITLADHACAVILRDSVGFANAASIRFSTGGDTLWAIVPVVEPDRRTQIRFRSYRTARPRVPEWADVFALLQADRAAMGELQYPRVLVGDTDSAYARPLSAAALELRRALRRHDTARDWALARNAILDDSSAENRAAASLVLANFPERDSTYHLLAEGLRSTDFGSSAAEMVLSALARDAPRRVDWAPARSALEALFGGTNLFAYTDLLDALVATEIDPALGRELAQVDTGLLLDHLAARNPFSPGPAHRFLVHVRGQDAGRDPAAWSAWLSERVEKPLEGQSP